MIQFYTVIQISIWMFADFLDAILQVHCKLAPILRQNWLSSSLSPVTVTRYLLSLLDRTLSPYPCRLPTRFVVAIPALQCNFEFFAIVSRSIFRKTTLDCSLRSTQLFDSTFYGFQHGLVVKLNSSSSSYSSSLYSKLWLMWLITCFDTFVACDFILVFSFLDAFLVQNFVANATPSLGQCLGRLLGLFFKLLFRVKASGNFCGKDFIPWVC